MTEPSFPARSFPRHAGRLLRLLASWALLLVALAPVVRAADPPSPAASSRGAVSQQEDSTVSQRGPLESLGATRWHKKGHLGKGFKVAILDSSFNGYRPLRGKTLPRTVETRSFRNDGKLEVRGNTHGTQCAEVIHAIAPDAELVLLTWEPDSPQKFLEAVRWARSQGVRVISCSVIIPSWSDGEGGGIVHRNLARLIGGGDDPDDMLIFASAGNTAQRHWSGPFQPAANGWHRWAEKQTWNRIVPWGDERVSVELACPGEGRYEMVVKDMKTGKEVGRGKRVSGRDRFCMAVRFLPVEGHTYAVRVRELTPSPSGFHLTVLGGNLQRSRQDGSICFPGDGARVLTVGAVDGEGRRQAYSSCGDHDPTKHKPDLVAMVPFAIQYRKEPFTGTSAAAPQAAAAAALYWSHDPGQTAGRVRQVLVQSAIHLDGFQGHRSDTGHGMVRLPDLGGR